jgi:hypothetical protein
MRQRIGLLLGLLAGVSAWGQTVGELFPPGAELSFDGQGRPTELVLAEDSVVQGLPLAGKKGRNAEGIFPAEVRAALSPEHLDLVRANAVRVLLHPSGRVAYGFLTAPVAFPRLGVRAAPGWTRLYPDGTPAELVLADAAVVDGFPLAAGSWLDLTPTGRLAKGVLAHDSEISGLALPAGAAFELITDADGRPLLGQVYVDRIEGLLDEAVVDGIRVAPADLLWLHPNGRIHYATLAEDTWIAGIPCGAGTVILRADGTVERASALFEDVRVGSKLYRRGDGFPERWD